MFVCRLRLVSVVAVLMIAGAVTAQNPPPKPPGSLLLQPVGGDKSIENWFQVSPRIFSGGEPSSEAAFKALAAQGIKTIVSVDGARPNLDLAKKYGLRYVHIPIGYDGVPREAQLKLTRLAREVKGSIYIHCHHGQHRGPAAAAIACVADGAVSAQDAAAILKTAKTSRDYPGLWRDVAAFETPPADAQLPALTEIAMVPSFQAAMSQIDRHFDNLKLCRTAGWKTPEQHPDLVPAQEALQLLEHFRESGRHLTADHTAEFKTWLAESETVAKSLRESLMAKDLGQAEKRFAMLQTSCKTCHVKYRDDSDAR